MCYWIIVGIGGLIGAVKLASLSETTAAVIWGLAGIICTILAIYHLPELYYELQSMWNRRKNR